MPKRNPKIPFDKLEVGDVLTGKTLNHLIFLFISDKTDAQITFSYYEFKEKVALHSTYNTDVFGYKKKYGDFEYAKKGELIKYILEIPKINEV